MRVTLQSVLNTFSRTYGIRSTITHMTVEYSTAFTNMPLKPNKKKNYKRYNYVWERGGWEEFQNKLIKVSGNVLLTWPH
jgi:hypothetical protein